ncbi:MAG TPA: hypothetical protein VML55_11065 [Planctomycetaceae bacterium]|nr:hypothetical protein [Planctomycetaceae bacterium]
MRSKRARNTTAVAAFALFVLFIAGHDRRADDHGLFASERQPSKPKPKAAVGRFGPASGVASKPHLPPSKQAWTLDEARGHLALNPRDPYIQYVALQLADADGRRQSVAEEIERWTRPNNWRTGRRGQVDLFSIFSGALAVQESLQLDTLRDDRPQGRGRPQLASVKELKGPTIKGHPWKEMLAGRDPAVSELSGCVPSDQYLVQSRSLIKLVDLAETGDLWATHLFNQAAQDATSARVGDRLREQLAVRVSRLTRPFYDAVVEQVAVTGSDLYLREGSDVTLIFKIRQPAVFKPRLDQFLDEAAKSSPDAARSTGRYGGIDYVHVATPDRRVHVFSAYPRPDLHVRSNSLVGLARVLSAIQGKSETGDPVERLGETDEFKYIRTLMPEGAPDEDVFVYLSDPFIRHMVGPKLKLTERRRMLGYNHLRMINHAAMMYRTQYGQRAKTLADLVDGGCARDVYGEGPLASPVGGEYALGPDGLTGWCSMLGTPRSLVPCCELPLDDVTQAEAEAYQAFLNEYNSYWRTFFDPIAIRIRVTPGQYRAETIVLPLINNSIYTGLSQTLGGTPKPLDALPVPKGNIFTLAMQFDKGRLVGQLPGVVSGLTRELEGIAPAELQELDVKAFVERGLGDQIGLHMYDATQLFEFNLTGFLGQAFGTFQGRNWFSQETMWISMLVASLNSPVYLSIPVTDAAIVDRFFDALDPLLAAAARRPERGWFFEVNQDFYKLSGDESATPVRTFALSFGPLKWRFFWARIGDGLYVATKKFVLDDIAAAHAERSRQPAGVTPDAGPAAHAMIRIRPAHWEKVLPDFQLGWAENNRIACLNNLGRLSGVARAYAAEHADPANSDPRTAAEQILDEAGSLYGVDFLSPDGGEYVLARDGRTMAHTVYGSQLQPIQPERPGKASETTRALGELEGVTVQLTFLEDGLHAVLAIDRK